MQKIACRQCQRKFQVTDDDLRFYARLGVPIPTLCPDDRERRRLIWRNERHLYKRSCDLCQKVIASIYPENCPFPVYCETCFWGDAWDSRAYGREIDWNRPFFEQLAELQKVVPRLAITHTQSVNSDYTLNSAGNKNCYLTSGSDFNEDCLYCLDVQRSRNCMECYLVKASELTYGSLDSLNLYQCVACQECESCAQSCFLFDCKNCQNCAFSANLRNKQYVLFNQQLNKGDYEKKMADFLPQVFADPSWLTSYFSKVKANAIHRYVDVIQSENVTGNHIQTSKNCQNVFDAEDLEDCSYIYYGIQMKDSYDQSCVGFKCSLLYEIMSTTESYNCQFCNVAFYCHDLLYCISCFQSGYSFGCIALTNHKEYCILNKQYSPEEYAQVKSRLIGHMQKTGEWGEFFPPSLSAFEYNRSAAGDYMPLSKEDALQYGYAWHDEESSAVPSPEERTCKSCSRNFRPVKQELGFHQKMALPLPEFCWGCRAQNLIRLRSPRRLFDRTCSKCGQSIQSPYSPERPERVYCEPCYLASVY